MKIKFVILLIGGLFAHDLYGDDLPADRAEAGQGVVAPPQKKNLPRSNISRPGEETNLVNDDLPDRPANSNVVTSASREAPVSTATATDTSTTISPGQVNSTGNPEVESAE